MHLVVGRNDVRERGATEEVQRADRRPKSGDNYRYHTHLPSPWC